MNKLSCRALVISLVGISGIAAADTASGSLEISGTIESSISLTIEAAPTGATNLGTASAQVALGNAAKYGMSAPAGFTETLQSSSWTLSAPVSVKVVEANSSSESYTLSAQLASAPSSGMTWKINGSAVTDQVAATLTSSGEYGATAQYGMDIVIADDATAGTFDDSFVFTATSN
jgi:hypothetical protein